MSDDLVKRLRAAHKNSPQRIAGSVIFEEAAARIERLETALRNIRELNMMEPDENGHRWVSSDLVEQEIIAALQEGQA